MSLQGQTLPALRSHDYSFRFPRRRRRVLRILADRFGRQGGFGAGARGTGDTLSRINSRSASAKAALQRSAIMTNASNISLLSALGGRGSAPSPADHQRFRGHRAGTQPGVGRPGEQEGGTMPIDAAWDQATRAAVHGLAGCSSRPS